MSLKKLVESFKESEAKQASVSSYNYGGYSASSYYKYKGDDCLVYFFPNSDLNAKPLVFQSRKEVIKFLNDNQIKHSLTEDSFSRYSEEHLITDADNKINKKYSTQETMNEMISFILDPIKAKYRETIEKNIKEVNDEKGISNPPPKTYPSYGGYGGYYRDEYYD